MKHHPTRAGENPAPRLALLPFVLALASFTVLPSCVTTGTTGEVRQPRGQRVGRGTAQFLAAQSSPGQGPQRHHRDRGARELLHRPPLVDRRDALLGFLREPGKPWSTAKLIIMNESAMKQPDRIPRRLAPGARLRPQLRISHLGQLHREEDLRPEFELRHPRVPPLEIRAHQSSPGFLFYPGEKYNPRHLPEIHPPFPGS